MAGKNKLKLYHGSETIIEKPFFGGGNHNNDYGNGFYCTESHELAGEWACSKERGGYINCYTLDMTGLRVLDLNGFDTLNWLAVLMKHRVVNSNHYLAEQAASYLLKNYYIDVSDYDIVRGYRADDSYFAFVRAFINNTISLEQLSRAMKIGNLGEQIVIKSRNAYEQLKFNGYEYAEETVYYPQRKARAEKACETYAGICVSADITGIHILDLLRREEEKHEGIS